MNVTIGGNVYNVATIFNSTEAESVVIEKGRHYNVLPVLAWALIDDGSVLPLTTFGMLEDAAYIGTRTADGLTVDKVGNPYETLFDFEKSRS